MKGVSARIALIRNYLYQHELIAIFFLGILLRIVVFIFQGPFNNDAHLGTIEYIYEHRSIPLSFLVRQSDHPPLYYILASLFFSGGEKIIQAFSLISSIGTLSVIYWLIKKLEFIQPLAIKKYCLLLASTLPQFIMFSNYISNDSLSFLIGSLIFLQIFLYINKPSRTRQNILAVYLGLGLLTKGSFLFFIPPLIFLVVLINFKKRMSRKQSIISLLIFISIFLALGSYKGIQNIIHFRRPIVFNIENPRPWMKHQRPTYIGLRSIYDINILKLCKYPTRSEHTKHSYPLMLYGSFWYQFVPESDFTMNKTVFKYLGSYIYIFALLPTLLFLIGSLRILFCVKSVVGGKISNGPPFNKATYEVFSLFLLLSSLVVPFYLGARFDVCSAFQGRYLFPSFFSIVVIFNSGLDYLRKRYAIAQKVVYLLLGCLYLLFLLYFAIEIANKVAYLRPVLRFFM
jgi:4-amino-4-deoxy-L-arabinose transferase-like glycosyltransferase